MIAGVDGTRDGWIVAMAESWPCTAAPSIHLAPTFADVVSLTATCSAVGVDMPFGLPSGSDVRACDMLAREKLAARADKDTKAATRLFLAPPREAIYNHGGNPKEFQRLHRHYRGVGAGLPVWGIVPKMLEVDAALTSTPSLQDRLVEFHPELAFAHLAGRVLASKHGAPGILERFAVLIQHIPALHNISVSHELRSATIDDVLDALVGLSTASYLSALDDRSSPQTRRLPARDVPRDAKGLRMEIWF